MTSFKALAVYPRAPWPKDVQVSCRVCTTLAALQGTHRADRELYQAAKWDGDEEAALKVVRRLLAAADYEFVRRQIAVLRQEVRLIAFPAPDIEVDLEQDGHDNALPDAFAVQLASRLDISIDDSILQVASVGRTKLGAYSRFVAQPIFDGDVREGAYYLLIDDVITGGVTFANLRSYILSRGGKVFSLMALASKSGQRQDISIDASTSKKLYSWGDGALAPFWNRILGHDLSTLTKAEGELVLDELGACARRGMHRDEALQSFYDRLCKAAAEIASRADGVAREDA